MRVSIVLGTLVTSLLPHRVPAPEVLKAVVVVLLYWFLYGSVLFVVCKLLGGRSTYLDTLSVSLQILAASYVASSFTSLIAISVLLAFRPNIPLVGDFLGSHPIAPFFAIGTLFLLVYVPLSMRALHRLTWLRTTLLFPIPLVMLVIAVTLYGGTGVTLNAPPP
jgi:hypothetical protein